MCVQEVVKEESRGKRHVYEQRYGLHTWQAMAIEAALGGDIIPRIKIQNHGYNGSFQSVSIGDHGRFHHWPSTFETSHIH